MLRTFKEFENCVIGATDGDIGHVKDLYFDDQAWVIRYLVVDTSSWLTGRKVLVSPISIQTPYLPAHRLAANITRDQVKNSPDIDTDKPVSRQHEVQYLGYYGYPNYWGAGMWGDVMSPMAMYPEYIGHGAVTLERQHVIAERKSLEREKHSVEDPHLRSCATVVGHHIHATDGEVGHVEGFLIDEDTWAIRYLVVNTSNWWLGHKVLISPQWISGVHWLDETVSVVMTRNAVMAAPIYEPLEELDREREAGLYAHHDRAPYWQKDLILKATSDS